MYSTGETHAVNSEITPDFTKGAEISTSATTTIPIYTTTIVSLPDPIPVEHRATSPEIFNPDSNQINLTGDVSEAGPVEPEPVCYFMDKLPAELRVMIYKMLLVNPITGMSDSIFEATIKYGLSPSTLQTSKTIHAEARTILYTDNTFFITTVYFHSDRHSCAEIRSPLARYSKSYVGAYDYGQFTMERALDIPSMDKVLNWRVLVSAYALVWPQPSPHYIDPFMVFCHTISSNKTRNIEILVIPGGLEAHSFESQREYFPLWRVLEPLRLLRGVSALDIYDASPDDIAHTYHVGNLSVHNLVNHVFDGHEGIYEVLNGFCKPIVTKSLVENERTLQQNLKAVVQQPAFPGCGFNPNKP